MGNCQSIDETKVQVPRQGPVTQIFINNCVWDTKYLGLYDYDAHQIQKRKFKVQGNATVIKDSDKLILIDQKMQKLTKGLTEHYKNSMFRLIRSDNYYQLVPIVYQQKADLVQKPLWVVVKSLPGRSYSIKQRDIIKLGKQKLKVREVVPYDCNPSVIIVNQDNIRVTKTQYEQLRYQQKLELKLSETVSREEIPVESTKTLAFQEPTQQNQNQNTCRICLEPGLTSNPLITPCHCTGTVKFIHLLCLKMWLSKQIKAVINDFSVTIFWKPLSCEMCKAHYKYRIYLDNQKFYTVDIPKPQKPYIVLQIMKKKSKDEGKIFKFITFKNKNHINIGRKKDVDVRISQDISVSRIHATLKYLQSSRQFILQDNKSKFGTVVLAKNGLKIRPHHAGISVQIGAQLFEFQALRQPSALKMVNYQLGQDYLRQDQSQESDNDQEQGGSEQQDQVNELPVEQGDRSPSIQRSPSIRRSHSLQAHSTDFH